MLKTCSMPLIFLLTVSFLCSFAAAGIRFSYKGLNPGISTINDAMRILGKPTSKILAGDQTIYKYPFVTVTSQKRTEKIETIAVDDPNYRDFNGFGIGMRQAGISEVLKVNPVGNTLTDKTNGIVYILNEEGIVIRIMYREISR